jgi:hypothetical protein
MRPSTVAPAHEIRDDWMRSFKKELAKLEASAIGSMDGWTVAHLFDDGHTPESAALLYCVNVCKSGYFDEGTGSLTDDTGETS